MPDPPPPPLQHHHHHRLIPLLLTTALASLSLLHPRTSSFLLSLHFHTPPPPPPPPPIGLRRHVAFDVREFGAVGDGKTVNTLAFEAAVDAVARNGGGTVYVPEGEWLTAPFNLTSFMTLFLDHGAVILGIDCYNYKILTTIDGERKHLCQYGETMIAFVNMTLFLDQEVVILAIDDETYWPLMPPLPSYGKGREHLGPRYGSLIHGQKLQDVVITGNNGTINGQGKTWWIKYRQKLLNHTRGPLVQIMWSRDIVISNVTLRDSPFWTLHPYDCKNVTIKNVTILAPIHEAPNTDGIDPDSCEDMIIEDCYISVGDDGIAIKSGWDQYGIAYGRPSKNILIRNLVIRSIVSAGVSIGSEMSGGVSNVTVENLFVWDSRRAIRIKTAPGRGGYVRHIIFKNITMKNVRVGIVIKTDYNEHPDMGFDPKAVPIIEDIHYMSIYGEGVRVPVRMQGSDEIPIKNVIFQDMSVGITYKKEHIFQCAFVEGRVIGTVFPAPCENLDLYDEKGQLIMRSVSQNISDIDYSF